MDFNPRTHMECDSKLRYFRHLVKISIHALTWSATYSGSMSAVWEVISIHALTWSATAKGLTELQHGSRFQSTHSHGVRRCLRTSAMVSNPISIHALTWSATALGMIMLIALIFQSTHSHGVRHIKKVQIFRDTYFNPRTHMECDLLGGSYMQVGINFNPRTHMECDENDRKAKDGKGEISIHALTWSAT